MSKQLLFYYSTADPTGVKYEPVINESAFDAKIESIEYTFEKVEGYGEGLNKGIISFAEDLTSIGSKAIELFQNGEIADLNWLPIIELPDTVKSIKVDSFEVSHLKTNLYDEEGNLVINGKLIRKKSNWNDEELNVPEGVEEIPAGIHYEGGGNWLKITLPSTLKRIGAKAFKSNEIKSIKLPKGLEEIGEWAFPYAKLSNLTIPDSVKKIGAQAFYANNKLKKVTLPKDLDIDMDEIFKSCRNLKEIIRK